MRILSGLGLALLVCGCLAAQRHGGSAEGHHGASHGARGSGSSFGRGFSSAGAVVVVPYAYPLGYGYGYSAPPPDYADSYQAPPPDTAAYGQGPGPEYAAAPPEPPPHSVIIDMEDSNPPAEPAHYYIALKDHHVYLAVAYWVDGNTLHYFLPGNTHNQVSLSLVDRDLTDRLNRESGTVVKLPEGS